MEADYRRVIFCKQICTFLIEWNTSGSCWNITLFKSIFLEIGLQNFAPFCFPLKIWFWSSMTKKFRLKGLLVWDLMDFNSARSASGRSIAQGRLPKPPALETAIVKALSWTPAIGAWIMGSSVPKKVLLKMVLTMTENFSKQREKASQSVRTEN